MNQQIVGTVQGLEQRNGGWVAVAILAPGKEYPVKLSTKKQELIGQAQQMMGQVVTAGYNEAEGNSINPHTGTPYINRYLEAIAYGQVDLVGAPTQIQPQQQMPQQPQFVPQPAPQAQNFQGQPQGFAGAPAAVPFSDQREAKIHRQTASKVAVELLVHLDPSERNLASLVRISEQLVKYYDEGVQWTTPPVQAPQPQAQQQHQGPPPAEYAPGYGDEPGDDGIPF
jgi:hypothetical protein